MISNLELRHIVESGFFPKKCVCTISPVNSMTVQILNEETGKEELTVTGIDTAALVSMRDVAQLVIELKEEMKLREAPPKLKARKTRGW